MTTKDIADEFKGLKITQDQDINILLLGESGVGKSAFINSFANYLLFKQFRQAYSEGEILMIIPSIITVLNEKKEYKTFYVDSTDDRNRYQENGAAGSQDVKTYVFPIGEGQTRLRLIDLPGLHNPRGPEQNNTNWQKILEHFSKVDDLHAICILMEPTTRITAEFKSCIKEILTRLEKSASKKIIFIFTNTLRGSNYTPEDTLPCLKILIDEFKAQPPHVEIPLKDNLFSFDNEAFKFLVASKHGINYNESDRRMCIESWDKSSKESWRLISYIVGDASRAPLKPHQVQNTTSINEARRLIIQLSQPLTDISQLIFDNIRILEEHQNNLRMENQSLDALKQKLYIPIIDLQVIELTKPVTVCTQCADVVKVGNINKWHYKQRCHVPCSLKGVAKECVGDPRLKRCAAMNERGICTECTCDFSVHMHVYYFTKTVHRTIVDGVVQNNIEKKEIALLEAQKLIGQIEHRKKELEEERETIIKTQRLIEQIESRKKGLEGELETIIRSAAHFAHFLQQNATSQFNDYYKAHIEDLINREKGLGFHCDLHLVGNLEALLRQYEEIKKQIHNGLKLKQTYQLGNVIPAVTAYSVIETIHKLYSLKLNGNKIREFIEKQETSRNSEYDKNSDDVHLKSTGFYIEEKKDKNTDDETMKQDWITTDDGKKKKINFKNKYQGSPQGEYHGPPQDQYQGFPQGPPQDQFHGFPLHHQYTPQNQHHDDHLRGPPGGHCQQSPNQKSYNNGQVGQHGPSYNKSGGGREQSHSLDHNKSQDRKSGKEKNITSGSNASEFNLFLFHNYMILLEAFLCWYLYNNGYISFMILLAAILYCHLYNLFVSKAFEFIPSICLNYTCTIEFLILLEAILCWHLYNGYVLFLSSLAAILCWYLYNCFVSKAFEFNHFIFLNYICTIEFLILLEAILCWYLYNGYVLFLILLSAILCWYLYL